MAKGRSVFRRQRAGTKSAGGLIVLAFAAFLIVVRPVSGADEMVTVHASANLGPFVAPVGFICGVDHQEKWPDEVMVAALNPKHWRLSKIQSYEAAAQHPGIEITYVISDPYGYSVGYPNATPWTDWEWYESYVQYIVQSRSEWFPEHPVAFWDVWNEPDHPYFWSGTYEQLLELFARTYNVIKAEDPSALVVGPSLSCFDPNSGGLENIIDFLVDLDEQYGVRLEVISWHENGSACVGTPEPWDILSNAQALRDALAAHFGPEYQPAFHVNEYGGTLVHLSAGWCVGYLYYLIAADIDGAMRACWNNCEEFQGPLFAYSNCWAGLNGMFMYDGETPQSVYWVYKAAADMEAGERLATEGPPSTNVLGSRDDAQERITLLVGRHYYSDPADVTVLVEDYPFPHEQVAVDIKRIPNTWAFCDVGNWVPKTYPLPDGPIPVSASLVSVLDGNLEIQIPDFTDGEAYIVSLSSPQAIPAMSLHGVAVMTLGLILAAALVLRRREIRDEVH